MNTNANVNVEEMEAFKKLIENCAMLGKFNSKGLHFRFDWTFKVEVMDELERGKYASTLSLDKDINNVDMSIREHKGELSNLMACVNYSNKKAREDEILMNEYEGCVASMSALCIQRGLLILLRTMKLFSVDEENVKSIISKYGFNVNVELL